MIDYETVRSAIVNVVENDNQMKAKLFGEAELPICIDDVTISLSSLDFAEFLIELEQEMGLEFAEDCMIDSKIVIKDLIERIIEIV